MRRCKIARDLVAAEKREAACFERQKMVAEAARLALFGIPSYNGCASRKAICFDSGLTRKKLRRTATT